MTVEEVKKNLLKTIDSIDRDKLSLIDLKLLAETLKVVSEIQTKSYSEAFAETMRTINMGFGSSYKAPTVSEMR